MSWPLSGWLTVIPGWDVKIAEWCTSGQEILCTKASPAVQGQQNDSWTGEVHEADPGCQPCHRVRVITLLEPRANEVGEAVMSRNSWGDAVACCRTQQTTWEYSMMMTVMRGDHPLRGLQQSGVWWWWWIPGAFSYKINKFGVTVEPQDGFERSIDSVCNTLMARLTWVAAWGVAGNLSRKTEVSKQADL